MKHAIIIFTICLLFFSSLDPFYDKQIKIAEDIYLLHDSGIKGYHLGRSTGENYFQTLLGPDIVKVIKFKKNLAFIRILHDSTEYYQMELTGNYQDSLIMISHMMFNKHFESKDSEILFESELAKRN